MPADLPERFGPYQVSARLGLGGMGEVYLAHDTRLDRDVALKVIAHDKAADTNLQSRFEREARAASALNHPNIVSIYDVGEQDGIQYIVSELVRGESLRQMISRGPLPPEELARIATQIADALAAAHAAGIIHRDLKPENIMVTAEGRVKVLDFGLARRTRQAAADSDSTLTQSTMTQPGVVMGTAGYMAPEQICGQEADARSDIFSVGVILYEMASGARAFQGRTSIETMSAVLKDEPPQLSKKPLSGMDQVIRRCLEKDPSRRYQAATELNAALEKAAAASSSAPKARWVLWSAPAAVVVVIGGAYWLAPWKSAPRPTVTPSAVAPAPAPPPPWVSSAPSPAAEPAKVPSAPPKPPRAATSPAKKANDETYQKAYEEGMLRLSERKWAEAADRLSEAIRLKPDSAPALLGRCRAAVAQQQFDQAIADCTAVIGRNPNSADAYHERGTANLRSDKFDQAVEDINAALRLGDENRAGALLVRGRAHNGLKEWGSAIQDFDEAIRLTPNVAPLHLFRGIALNNRSQFRKAIEDFDEALRLQPNLALAYGQRARAKQRTGDAAGAAADRKKAEALRR